MDDQRVLCLLCRSTFTDEETVGANACPKCGNRGLPANVNDKATLTFTHHEWRLLFIWASNWADHIKNNDQAGYDSPGTIMALIGEARRQVPDLPALSLWEDVRRASDSLGLKIEMHRGGEVETFEPPTKQ